MKTYNGMFSYLIMTSVKTQTLRWHSVTNIVIDKIIANKQGIYRVANVNDV